MIIACGALGGHLREILARRGWRAELHCLPALLHNRPAKIAFEAERLALQALARGQRVAVAYADCGTYGALDEVCVRLGLRRLPGLHCYDVLAGPDALCLWTSVPTEGRDLTTVAEFEVDAGQRVPFLLMWHPSHLPTPEPVNAVAAVDDTEAWWAEWTAASTYAGDWSDAVSRSLAR